MPLPRPQSRSSCRQGFSLAELLVVVAIVVILLSIFVPYVMKVRESDRRVRCAENLRAIGKALASYADQNGRDYPRVRFDPLVTGFAAFTGAESPDPFAKDSMVHANDVTASLWLLARQHLVTPEQFICPSAGDTTDPLLTANKRVKPEERSNFTRQENLSYSYASPFSTAGRFRLNSDMLAGDFAVLADRNPGRANGSDVTAPAFDASERALSKANSRNHGRAGQQTLYADGHVQFQKTPYCGFGDTWKRDNIYTAASNLPLAPDTQPKWETNGVFDKTVGPAWEKDSYLVPADGQ